MKRVVFLGPGAEFVGTEDLSAGLDEIAGLGLESGSGGQEQIVEQGLDAEEGIVVWKMVVV